LCHAAQGFTFLRNERGYIDQPCHFRIVPCLGNDRATIGMAYQQHGPSCALMSRLVEATSSAIELRGFCTATACNHLACNNGISFDQLEHRPKRHEPALYFLHLASIPPICGFEIFWILDSAFEAKTLHSIYRTPGVLFGCGFFCISILGSTRRLYFALAPVRDSLFVRCT
jgi:hypothetical protein